MAVFDTNIIIDYLRGKERAAMIINEYGMDGIAITAVTGYELIKGYVGVTEETKLNELFNRIKIYPLDSVAMKLAGKLYRELKGTGKPKKEADLLIAGIAIANGETLVTDDRKDFSELAGVMGNSLVILKK
ncbi:protein containing PilT protein [mine drainage metagenome]|uniref:Protein containing PilT protein n=1 Tax=mine drainage metagenome TaxID=410659 RepID=T0YGC3_9ZZZZ